jgi:hypothetical protein
MAKLSHSAALTSKSIDPKWLATVRGRIGYLVVPNALLYFTGGAAFADVDHSASARMNRHRHTLRRHPFQRQ